MKTVRLDIAGGCRVKTIADERLNEYLSYGWTLVNEVKQEPVVKPVPVIVETPLQKLEKAVDAVVDAPKAVQKRKAGRPPKKW